MSALHSRCDNWMTLRGIAPDDEYKVSFVHIGNRARIAAIADSAEQTHGRGSLAIARTIVDIVGANHGPGQLLHQITFFIRTLRRRNEPQGIRPTLCFYF